MSHILSKSSYLKGVKCEKALYYNKYRKDLKDETSEETKAIFSRGDKVGKLAQDLFPGGIDVTPENFYDFSKSIEKTQNAIIDGIDVIYEAAFQFDGVLCAVDILERDGSGWKAYEVKSGTSVTNVHITDASVQYYVINNCGIKLHDISIIVLDNTYEFDKKLNIQKLFKIESVYDTVVDMQTQVRDNIIRFKKVLSSKHEPAEFIGAKCSKPYDCDFIGHCWKDVPEYSIFNLANIRKTKAEELYHSGFTLITDLPYDYKLTESQNNQVQCERDGSVIINKKELRYFINELIYPISFLDFETTQMGIPQFKNQKPYQQIPFQYSLHSKISENSDELHHEFLAESRNKDPRLDFITSLIRDCGSNGSILVYNLRFEKSILNHLIIDFPEYEVQLQLIIDRMVDLMLPFKNKHYYTPEMQGSYSIKKVLPALCPELSYQDLEIKEGGAASRIFGSMLSGEFSGDESKVREQLLNYCKLDTWAMVKLLDKIYSKIS